MIVGIAQLQQRIKDPLEGKEPLKLMADAVRAAAKDAGAPQLLAQTESVRVVRGVWRYKQPAAWVAAEIGAPDAETMGTPYGGNMVQSLVNQSALDILNGDKSLIVITGAENGNSQAKAAKAGIKLEITETEGAYDRMLGDEKPMTNAEEEARGIRQPIQVYPMFENALRHHRGESIEEHKVRISELWAGFSKVAGDNPHAWLRDVVDAETIRTPGPTNRMISFPYPKLMNSNNAVDMSAALIMCSVEKARELGIPEAKWVYPWAGTDGHDHYYVSNRDNLYSSPAIRIAGKRVMSLLGLQVSDLDLVDVYSCFPVAVQVAVNELGLDESKTLTVTGGLTFGGGPLNNYVMHSIARMVELLRASPEKKGLITANGGYLTKHAFGIYSARPPAQDFLHEDVQAEIDATPRKEVLGEYDGPATIESYTVMFGPNGPGISFIAALTPDNKRVWASSDDQAVMADMQQREFCGLPVTVSADGKFAMAS
ncbi:MAG: acetyl-CoA acetyltransferase [Pseudomonadales bacterium]|nr:acetyl-CoA acetyltransferase [Pseudomonadales bacterium]